MAGTRIRLWLCAAVGVATLAGCFPTEMVGTREDGGRVALMFYPGGNRLKDLVIIDGVNHFGQGQYQMDDPLADVGFRFDDGTRVQAECTLQGKDLMGDAECGEYTVYRSDFPLIPQGTRFPRPDMF